MSESSDTDPKPSSSGAQRKAFAKEYLRANPGAHYDVVQAAAKEHFGVGVSLSTVARVKKELWQKSKAPATRIGRGKAAMRNAAVRAYMLKNPTAKNSEIKAAMKKQLGVTVHSTRLAQLRKELAAPTPPVVITEAPVSIPDVPPDVLRLVRQLRGLFEQHCITSLTITPTSVSCNRSLTQVFNF